MVDRTDPRSLPLRTSSKTTSRRAHSAVVNSKSPTRGEDRATTVWGTSSLLPSRTPVSFATRSISVSASMPAFPHVWTADILYRSESRAFQALTGGNLDPLGFINISWYIIGPHAAFRFLHTGTHTKKTLLQRKWSMLGGSAWSMVVVPCVIGIQWLCGREEGLDLGSKWNSTARDLRINVLASLAVGSCLNKLLNR